jgi:uncharacterized protein (TIGR03435 family)
VSRAPPLLLFTTAFGFAGGQTFDIASVKLLDPGAPKRSLYEGGPGTSDPGRLHVRVNMSALLVAAFSVATDQVQGPPWLLDFSAMPFYDITAAMPPGSNKADVEGMLQNLLAERFQLAFHRDTANFPGYRLVVDRGGPKLPQGSSTGADGFPAVAGPRIFSGPTLVTHRRVKFQEQTLAEFAVNLGFLLGKAQGRSLDDGFFQPRVVDKTGLSGKYTFILDFDCPLCVPLTARSAPAGDDPASATLPDIFGALQKLGLKLEKTTDVPLGIVIVDRVNRTPTGN